MRIQWRAYSSLTAAIIAGVLASLCCVGPFMLLFLGMSGVWISHLAVFAPFRPIAILIMLFFLGLAFWQIYFKPITCHAGNICVRPQYLRVQRILFWVITVILLALWTFSWYADWLY